MVIKESNDDDDDILANKDSLNAYVDAVRQGPVRGQKNKLKWKKQGASDNWDGDDDDDNKEVDSKSKNKRGGNNSKGKGGRITKSQPKFKARKKF